MADVKRANVLFLDKKFEQAARAYYEGAQDGDAECAFNYAYCLLTGTGVQRDERAAKSFFSFATELRGGDAAYNLAVMYLHGVGVKRDYKKVYSYMYDAARGGCIEAQLYLGIAHTLGAIFEPDVVCISRIPFHTPIFRSSGLLLEGEVPYDEEDEELRFTAVRHDPGTAFQWFKIAARHDSTYTKEYSLKSKFLYARCFVDGLGTEFNRDKAEKLMLLAAHEGSQDAVDYISTEAPHLLEKLGDKDYMKRLAAGGAN